MTSGITHAIPLASIIVNRPDRQRRELKDIPVLADSIRRLGLIHPPVVTREHVLVAGERRVEACRSLGWTDILVQYVEDLDPSTLHAIELEENVKRLDIPWQDQCRAIEEYHRLRSVEPGWTQTKTAEALGIEKNTVAEKLAVAKEIVSGNKAVAEAPIYSTARGLVARAQQRAKDNELLALRDAPAPPDSGAESILTADFSLWSETYDGPKFNLLHCDFPYGINTGERKQGNATTLEGSYDDSPDVYFSLLSSLARNLDRLLLPSAHLIFWFSMKFYRETLDQLQQMGWTCDGFPLTWVKSDNTGLLPDPQRGPRRVTEFAFFASRGDRKIVRAVGNAFSHPTVSGHVSEKPEEMLRHFFRMLVDEHTRLLDPTCGSGAALRAATALGAQHVLGLELNPDFAAAARERLAASRKPRSL